MWGCWRRDIIPQSGPATSRLPANFRGGPIINYMLRKRRLKKYARMWLMSKGLRNYSKTAFDDNVQFWQAGKGLGNINSVTTVAEVIKEFSSVKI